MFIWKGCSRYRMSDSPSMMFLVQYFPFFLDECDSCSLSVLVGPFE